MRLSILDLLFLFISRLLFLIFYWRFAFIVINIQTRTSLKTTVKELSGN